MSLSTDIWVWVGVLLTICIYSFLYRDNPLYRLGEHIFVGVANAFTLSFMVHRIIVPIMWRPFAEACQIAASEGIRADLFQPQPDSSANFLVIIPGLVGLLYFGRFLPGQAWLVRFPIGMFMGYYAGRTVPAYFEGSVFPQMRGTLITQATFDAAQGGGLVSGIFSIIILVGVLGTLTYFYFSKEHKGVIKWGAQTGIIFVMVGFGASFGFTVMARVSLAIGRFVFLLRDWLGIIS
jgi:hypothetical protein